MKFLLIYRCSKDCPTFIMTVNLPSEKDIKDIIAGECWDCGGVMTLSDISVLDG